MPQISFTKNNSDVYDRFSRLLLEEQLKRGKLTAPQMLDLVLDAFEAMQIAGQSASKSLLDLLNATKDLDELTPDEIAALDEAIEEYKPVSLRAYIADAEANDPNLKPENETE